MWPKYFWLIYYSTLCIIKIINCNDLNELELNLELNNQNNDQVNDELLDITTTTTTMRTIKTTTTMTTDNLLNGDVIREIEIKTLTGEPNYKSVNLTWGIEEIEFTELMNHRDDDHADDDDEDDDGKKSTSTSSKPLKNIFTIYYCEMQNWGPNRCNSKEARDVIANTDNEIDIDSGDRKHKQYSMVIDNLRMATKYSFHIRSQQQRTDGNKQKITGRSDSGGLMNTNGQTIIVPTKGFSAYATKCLPDASEIEIETGPYFGGRIFVETAPELLTTKGITNQLRNSDDDDDDDDCIITGNPESIQEKYIMRIDHKKCGSSVHPETLSVETFITVQENLGIFTHSTRRFIVVCNYQPDMLTVRASFSVPSRTNNGDGSAAPAAATGNQHHASNGNNDNDNEWRRNGRERKFKLVGKDALVLKEPPTDIKIPINQSMMMSMSMNNNVVNVDDNDDDSLNGKKLLENIIIEVNYNNNDDDDDVKNPKYLSLIQENGKKINHHRQRSSSSSNNNIEADQPPIIVTNSDYTGFVIALALSMIMVGALIFILQRENRQKFNRRN